jgi:hypothetical protein
MKLSTIGIVLITISVLTTAHVPGDVLTSIPNAQALTRDSLEQLQHNLLNALSKLNQTLVDQYGESVLEHFQNGLGMFPEAREVLKHKILKSIVFSHKFTISFTGTSVTECGDNYWNQSYAHVFATFFEPIAAACNVGLTVRNLAQGSNPIIPYDVCFSTVAGEDSDVITWEQDMMGDSVSAMELVQRIAASFSNQAAILQVIPKPSISQIKKIQKYNYKYFFAPGAKDIREVYARQGLHSISILDAIPGLAGNPQFSMNLMFYEGKNFGKGAWHPAPGGHQAIGLHIVWHYAQLWKEAFDLLKEIAESSGSTDLSKIVSSYLEENRVVPEDIAPLACNGIFYGRAGDPLPMCATVQEPFHERNMDLTRFVVDTKIVDDRPQTEILGSANYSGVWYARFRMDRPVGIIDSLRRGSPSLKMALIGNNESGSLFFEFESGSGAPILICQPRNSKALPRDLFVDSDFFLDGKPVSPQGITCGQLTESATPGLHRVEVRPVNDGQPVMISHLVWPRPK